MVLVTGELDVTYDGQPTVHLKPGMYAYGPPKAPHDGRCVSEAPCTLFIAFELPVVGVVQQRLERRARLHAQRDQVLAVE